MPGQSRRECRQELALLARGMTKRLESSQGREAVREQKEVRSES